MEAVIKVACDVCNLMTLTQDILWGEDGSATCEPCAEKMLPDDLPVEKIPAFYPLYFMYSEDGDLLHITSDMRSPEQWKLHQGKDWWWYHVANVQVKFFESAKQAGFAAERLRKNLAPSYGAEPSVDDDVLLDGTTVNTVNLASPKRTQERILSVRISEDMNLQMIEAATLAGVKRTDWIRAALYNAVRKTQAERVLPESK